MTLLSRMGFDMEVRIATSDLKKLGVLGWHPPYKVR
jgi:hypothetical protein